MSLQKIWDNIKWYVVAFVLGVVVVALFVFGVKDDEIYQDLFDVLYQDKQKRLKDKKSQIDQKLDSNQTNVEDVDRKIQKVQNKRGKIDEKVQDAKPEEVAKEFMDMGY